MKSFFHAFNFYAFSFSILLYLLTSSINTKAAEWGLSYLAIGLMNFLGCLFYVFSALVFGRMGDRTGFKRNLSSGMIIMAISLVYGFFWAHPIDLVVSAIGMNIFFGFFFPSIEGLLSKSERAEGVDPAATVIRFVLSWSAGNMLGMALGPFLIQRYPIAVFAYGILLSLFGAIHIRYHMKKYGELLPGPYDSRLKESFGKIDLPNIRDYRRVYRVTFLLAGVIYTSGMALFPKLISSTGIPLESVGFLTVGANIGVFLSFIFMSFFRFWVGSPRASLFIMTAVFVAAITTFFMPETALTFFLSTLFSGATYAVPYTFAIFYGLNSQDDDHGKQGGFHESMVGVIFGVGPLLGGYFLQVWTSLKSMGIMASVLMTVIIVSQMTFIKRISIKR